MILMDWLSRPWPWFFSGIAISFIMVALIYFGKTFGFSSNLSNICSMVGLGNRVKFFDFDWKEQRWNLWFLVGSVAGGYISATYLKDPRPIQISSATIRDLSALHIHFDGNLNPGQIFGLSFSNLKNLVYLFLGGLMIGFGTRYAGGCTSGHAITGLSQLQWPSLVAVIGFFIGGLIMTHFIFPVLF